MIRTLATIAGITIQNAGIRALSRANRAATYLNDHVDGWKKNILKELMIFGTIAAFTLSWILICQVITNTQVNWAEKRHEQIEICEGLTVEFIYLE